MAANKTVTPAQAVAIAKSYKGCDYWYCSSGEAGTRAWLDEVRRRAPGMWTAVRYANALKQCDGKPKFDCVGLMRKATGNEKNPTALNMNAEALRKASNPQPISTLPEISGVMLFIASKSGKPGHVGIYCGNGIVCESHGFKRVDVWSIKNQKWEQWGFGAWIDYSGVNISEPRIKPPAPTLADLRVKPGDKVRIKDGTTNYWPGGPKMPTAAWFWKNPVFTVEKISADGKNPEVKGGEPCVLLGNGNNTWCALIFLERMD